MIAISNVKISLLGNLFQKKKTISYARSLNETLRARHQVQRI